MPGVHFDFDLFNRELLKTEDRVLTEIQPIQNEEHSLNAPKRRKPSQASTLSPVRSLSSAPSSCSFFPIDAHQEQHHEQSYSARVSLSPTSTNNSRASVQLPFSTDTSSFDKEVWDIVMEAKKAIHEQESNEPFNPQDHEIISSLPSDHNEVQSFPPSEPSLPEKEGPLMATFDDGRSSVKVSIAFNKRQPSTLVATFNNGRPPMNVSITFDSSSRSSTNTSSIMSTLSDTLEATDEQVNISDKLKELKGKMKSRLNAAQMGNVLEALDVTTSDIIRIKDGLCLDDLTPSQQMLVGYNQSAEPPSSVYEQPDTHHPVNVEYQLRTDTLKKVFKDANLKTLDGKDIEEILNLWSFPFGEIDLTTERVVFNLFHYETMQEHLGFRGKGKQRHAFRARHSTGDLISTTPAFVCSNLGLENFLQTINGDILPFAIYKDTKPTDMVSEETYSFMMKAYIHYLVRPAAVDKRIVIAIGSKATCKTFAKFAYGGLQQLFAAYDMDPTQWISASDGKLEVNFHCEALYNILYCICMYFKAKTNDAFATNTRRVIDPNAEPCTFAMGYFEEGSDIFELIQRNFLSLCRLGGANSSKKRYDSVLSYHLLLEEKLTPKEALDFIKSVFSVESRNLVVAWLKFDSMLKIGGQLEREEEIDIDEVNEIASLVGMKANELLEKAEAFKEGGVKGRAKGLATTVKKGQVSWEEKYGELVEFKKEHDHCRVPHKYDANPQLAEWVHHQRQMYKKEEKSEIEMERIDKLNAIGFTWVVQETQWDDRFDELVEFKKEHDHCLVPKGYKANPQLADWVKTQREMYKKKIKSEIDLKRIKLLNAIDFVWKPNEYKWNVRFDELVAFKEEFKLTTTKPTFSSLSG